MSRVRAGDFVPAAPVDSLAPAVGANLRRLRTRRGLSLERLARRAGLSRGMLSQVELGRSAPTINSLWKIARALNVTFAALVTERSDTAPIVLPATSGTMLKSYDGTFSSRTLFPASAQCRTEFYELRLQTRGAEPAGPHPPGTVENLVVAAGAVEIDINGVNHRLETGDAILFAADVPHFYRDAGAADATMYVVVSHAADSV
jgi:transcriptional regulator with XRE-family HTH domain